MFSKGTPNADRKARKSKRVSKGKIEPESKLQKQADKLYKGYGIKYIRIPDNFFGVVNGCRYLPTWFKIYFNTHLSGWSDNILLFKSGKFACVELKSEIGKLRPSQKTFRKLVGEDNFYTCRTIDEVILVLKEYGVVNGI